MRKKGRPFREGSIPPPHFPQAMGSSSAPELPSSHDRSGVPILSQSFGGVRQASIGPGTSGARMKVPEDTRVGRRPPHNKRVASGDMKRCSCGSNRGLSWLTAHIARRPIAFSLPLTAYKSNTASCGSSVVTPRIRPETKTARRTCGSGEGKFLRTGLAWRIIVNSMSFGLCTAFCAFPASPAWHHRWSA